MPSVKLRNPDTPALRLQRQSLSVQDSLDQHKTGTLFGIKVPVPEACRRAMTPEGTAF